jgi:hypothetical protein
MINKRNLYVSPLLTNISLAYRNEEYINEKILPVVPVQKDTAQIATYGMDNLRIEESLRAQGAGANEVRHSVSIGEHYILKDHALKEFVTLEEEDNADSPIAPRKDAVENLTDRIQVIKEKELADTLSNTSIITQNVTLSGTDQWSDFTNSDPFDDIKTAMEAVRTGSGMLPNTFVMSYKVMMTLMVHPDLIARLVNVTTVSSDMVMQALRMAFPNIKNIFVGSALYNSGVEGGTDTLADIWGKHFWVGYISDRPRLKSRSLGFTYTKVGQNRQVEVLPFDADKKGQFVRVSDKYDQKLVDNKCFYLIKNAIA